MVSLGPLPPPDEEEIERKALLGLQRHYMMKSLSTSKPIDERDILLGCVADGGPFDIYETIAKIKVCGRCGHQVALHHGARAYVPPLQKPGPGRERLG